MKFLICLIGINGLLGFLCSAQGVVNILNLSHEYSYRQPVTITLQNNGPTTIVFSIGIQKYANNGWIVFCTDIDDLEPGKMQARLRSLPKLSSLKFCWKSWEITELSQGEKEGLFRIYIVYSDSNVRNKSIFTQTFKINNSK